jgi:hypothetical protein
MNSLKICSISLSLLLLSACGGERKEAEKKLKEAENMYENKLFSTAKCLIDSINTLYPREIAVRKKALTLMRRVERGECEKNIAYCDSLLPIRLQEAEALKKGFVFEKDTAYDLIGRYLRHTMTVERNLQRCYIRCGVDEDGEMYMASVYFANKPIDHAGLKLSTANGIVAETPLIPYDGGLNYRFKDLDNQTTEVVTYRGEHCKTIATLVYLSDLKERIKAEFIGRKTYTLYLSESDKKNIKATYELALVLSEINAMQKEKVRSERKIIRIDEKLHHNEMEK